MRINYNILWIEDELIWLKGAKAIVEDIVEESGFKTFVKNLNNEVDAISFIEHSNLEIFDIILVDYKIRNNEIGNFLIEKIRVNNQYTDIIFYSASLEKIMGITNGVDDPKMYISSRSTDDFIAKVESSFNRWLQLITPQNLTPQN